jgi:DNA (cytosine-5)-methyltransferase 1
MSKPTAVGAYVFAGGFSVGVRSAGFNVLAHLEDGPYGAKTVHANLREVKIFDVPDTWPIRQLKDQVDFIYANPPCAPFSSAGMSPLHHRGVKDEWYKKDPRVNCIHRTIGLLAIRPKVLAFESVAQIWKKARPLILELASTARDQGYSVTCILFNNVDVGVPQAHRKRFFFIAHRVAFNPQPPNGHHVSVQEAIAHLAKDPGEGYPANPKYATVCAYTRPGQNLRDAWNKKHPDAAPDPKTGRMKGRPGFSEKRLKWEGPGNTAIGGPKLWHPDEVRYLTVREQQVYCTYPVDYQFVTKSIHEKYAQIAQAVLPAVGKWLGSKVQKALLLRERRKKPHVKLLNYLEPTRPIIIDLEGEVVDARVELSRRETALSKV